MIDKNVLLLEDEESVNRGISFMLEKEGYKVFSCFNIHEADTVFRRESVQIILCDVTLPEGSSLNWIKNIRKESDVHIICITALDSETDYINGYYAGADDYITKPFSLSVLLLKVNAYFNKFNKEETKYIKIGHIKCSLTDMKVYLGEKEVPLTRNEWKLLKLFMENPHIILTKKQLLEQLFDIDGNYVDENTLAVNVRRLREKIENEPSNPQIIRNVRGVGYVYSVDKDGK